MRNDYLEGRGAHQLDAKYTYTDGPALCRPHMQPSPNGFRLPADEPRIPLLYALLAGR